MYYETIAIAYSECSIKPLRLPTVTVYKTIAFAYNLWGNINLFAFANGGFNRKLLCCQRYKTVAFIYSVFV